MTVMDDLVTWLRAQLDDDERTARAAAETEPGGQWRADHDDMTAHVLSAAGHSVVYQDSLTDAEAEHVVRWDPARVLAEVDAKRLRLVVIEHQLADDPTDETARYLAQVEALPYAQREGYQPDWRPEQW